MAEITKEQIETLVDTCVSDVGYLLSLHSKQLGLDSTELFDKIKDKLEDHFRVNIRGILCHYL